MSDSEVPLAFSATYYFHYVVMGYQRPCHVPIRAWLRGSSRETTADSGGFKVLRQVVLPCLAPKKELFC